MGKYVNSDTGCVFDHLLLNHKDTIEIKYKPVEDAQPYARSVVTIFKDKVEEKEMRGKSQE